MVYLFQIDMYILYKIQKIQREVSEYSSTPGPSYSISCVFSKDILGHSKE